MKRNHKTNKQYSDISEYIAAYERGEISKGLKLYRQYGGNSIIVGANELHKYEKNIYFHLRELFFKEEVISIGFNERTTCCVVKYQPSNIKYYKHLNNEWMLCKDEIDLIVLEAKNNEEQDTKPKDKQ